MPIYEYRCENGHTFEAFQSMTEDALTECEVCGAPVQKVLHSPAIHFKGSGFHNTDYGTRKSNKGKDGADSAKTESGSGSETGSSGSDSGASPKGDSPKSGDSGSKVGASTKPD